MRPVHLLLAVLLLGAVPAAAAPAEPPALAKARALYNAANYEGAIDAASVARLQPEWSHAAALVIARSHIERYRQTANPADLVAAREALGTIRSDALTARDQVDLLIGLGQALYLGELFGAAAELFDTALNAGSLMEPRDRLMLLDWWATALDREAQSRPVEQRTRPFERIMLRMEQELQHDVASPVANYWLAVAARGTGNVDRAWGAAIAAWVRAGLVPETAEQLRADVDRLVTQALIAERARTRPATEREEAIASLQAEWDLVKQQWK
jgi:hypothetical protein